RVIPQLLKARPLIAAINDPLAKVKLKELDEAVALCAGLWVEAQAREADVAPGGTLNFTTSLMNRSSAKVTLEGLKVEGIWNQEIPAKKTNLDLNKNLDVPVPLTVPAGQPYTSKYWLAKPPAKDVYQVDDQQLIGLPDNPPAAQVCVLLSIDGTPIEL